MPLYEYDHCGQRFERIRKFSEPNADCPVCGESVNKLISVPSPAWVPGGTRAGGGDRVKGIRLGDMPDSSEWIDQAIVLGLLSGASLLAVLFHAVQLT